MIPDLTELIAAEGACTSIDGFHLAIPGLLQTPEYAQAVVRGTCPPGITEQEIADVVAIRMERQKVLSRVPVTCLIDWSALFRLGAYQAEQASRLLAAPATVQVVPFSAGLYPGLLGPFILLGSVGLFRESQHGNVLTADETEVAEFRAMFEAIRELALSPGDSAAMITELLR